MNVLIAYEPLDQKTMDEIKERLVRTYSPQDIYLLEPRTEESIDIAILAVVDGEDIPHYRLMTAGHKALIGVKVAKSILVYTRKEFEEYSQDPSTLSYSIRRYGKHIYARS